MIHSPQDIERLVSEQGFLPFFAGEIAGFSIEEQTPPEFWFPDDTIEGVWEWKGTVILEGDCAYGKLYGGKACYVSMDFFPDLANYRRSLRPLTPPEEQLLATLREHKSLLSKELKRLCGYVKPRQPRTANPIDLALSKAQQALTRTPRDKGRASFDTLITRLQMGGHVVTADFEYAYDRQGQRYGWGVARYCTPEDFFGPERMTCPRTPQESAERILSHLRQLLPHATEAQLRRFLG